MLASSVGLGLFSMSLKCSAHLFNWSSRFVSVLPSLSRFDLSLGFAYVSQFLGDVLEGFHVVLSCCFFCLSC